MSECQRLNQESGFFAVIGDTQSTPWFEDRLLGREQNKNERRLLLADLGKESVDWIVHLGDLVFFGALSAQWLNFGRELGTLSSKILPIMGNHDYAPLPWVALKHIRSRFPAIGRTTWYQRRFGPLGLVWLDSNELYVSATDKKCQLEWFGKVLEDFEKTPEVRGVIVFTHHPPFTNSKKKRHSNYLREKYLPVFLRYPKTIAMISGHAHTLERFEIQSKVFIVSGGGGGPRVELKPIDQHDRVDLIQGLSLRPFHYLKVTPTQSEIGIEVRGLQRGEAEVRSLDRFILNYPEI